jgi:hypothetical protein
MDAIYLLVRLPRLLGYKEQEAMAALERIDIGKRSPAVPVIPPGVRVRTRRFGGLR